MTINKFAPLAALLRSQKEKGAPHARRRKGADRDLPSSGRRSAFPVPEHQRQRAHRRTGPGAARQIRIKRDRQTKKTRIYRRNPSALQESARGTALCYFARVLCDGRPARGDCRRRDDRLECVSGILPGNPLKQGRRKKLRAMVQTTCTVIRSGKEVEIPMHELVPGDIVVLTAGSIIPADLRLISAKDFFVSQSALTGRIHAD